MSPQERVTAAFLTDRDDVYRYLLIMGLQPAEAQEATQEAFLRLYTAVSRGDDIRSMRAWVFRVVHNLALKTLSDGRAQQPLTPDIEEVLGDRSKTPEAVLLKKERMQQLLAELRELSPQQRQC